jgi:hypothetical protein
MNLGSEKKRLEKLHSWHNKLVKGSLVAQPGFCSVSASQPGSARGVRSEGLKKPLCGGAS